MEKISNLGMFKSKINLICWDLDGTLFDTESVWFKMHDLVIEQYGSNLNEKEISQAQEKIAGKMYRTIGYRANADKAILYFKEKGIYQALVNQCPQTNKAMMENENVSSTFALNKFDSIISEDDFSKEQKIEKKDLFLKALEKAQVSDVSKAIAIEDLPNDLKIAKEIGMTTIWARNEDYPFSEEELNDIKKYADFYVDDFTELINN